MGVLIGRERERKKLSLIPPESFAASPSYLLSLVCLFLCDQATFTARVPYPVTPAAVSYSDLCLSDQLLRYSRGSWECVKRVNQQTRV
ncbi:hypothetical protein L1987_22266 [Smallanthus sonchifolius]|uniref:Uncharacterized protein n=1 Tax=Smallanthus sonchifolius TaxID=185202 RepID=A0ACB9IFV6_9ASTR|nr:hypothetical protein L1987_22266 [Smallanthus sonchifolius]